MATEQLKSAKEPMLRKDRHRFGLEKGGGGDVEALAELFDVELIEGRFL